MTAIDQADERKVSFEWLKKFGTKWAVLAALVVDLGKRGVRIPREATEQLKLARMEIMSGCFSPCEVGCMLGKLEGQLVSIGSALGAEYLRPWFDLLGQAMEGRIDPRRLSEIPALEPIINDCKFLGCRCGEAGNLPESLRPEAVEGCR
jgi:hypothetical protein